MRSLLGLYILVGRTPVEEPDLFRWDEWRATGDRRVALTVREGRAAISKRYEGTRG